MSPSDWVTLIAAGAGAFLGSLSAFGLQVVWQHRQERTQRHGALLEAQFALSMQLNAIVNIRNQYLSECRNDPDRYMRLVPFYGSPDAPRVDFSALGFVATKDDASIMQQVHMAESAYFAVITALDTRNALMVDSYTAATPIGPMDFETGEQKVSMDARKARVLKGITDSLYQAVDYAIELGHEGVQSLAAVSKRLYPKLPALSVEEVPEPAGESS